MGELMKIPIVFAFTDNYSVPAYVAISSLLNCANVDTQYEVIVLHIDVTLKHRRCFKKMFQDTRHKIRFLKIDDSELKNYPKSKSWPAIVYVRLFMDELLKKYKKVIYSDVDVLFKGDLAEVYQTDITDYEWAGIRAERNGSRMIGHRYFANNKNKYIYMSGFMLCNLEKMREESFSDIVRDNIEKYGDRLLMFDLDILNMSSSKIFAIPIRFAYLVDYYECNDIRETGQYKYMRSIYTYKELVSEKQKAVIIHYAGARERPWKRLCPPKEYYYYIKKMPLKLKMEYVIDKVKK